MEQMLSAIENIFCRILIWCRVLSLLLVLHFCLFLFSIPRLSDIKLNCNNSVYMNCVYNGTNTYSEMYYTV